jgi:hypothetical protein
MRKTAIGFCSFVSLCEMKIIRLTLSNELAQINIQIGPCAFFFQNRAHIILCHSENKHESLFLSVWAKNLQWEKWYGESVVSKRNCWKCSKAKLKQDSWEE